MNAIITSPLNGELIGPADTLTVVCSLHPLRQDRSALQLGAGITVAEIVEAAIAAHRPGMPADDLVVYLGDDPVLAANWPRIRPKPGTTIVLKARAAAFIAPIIAAVSAAVGAVSSLIAGGGILGGLLSSAIGFGLKLLMGALFPARQPKLDNDKPKETYSIGGGRNESDPFGPVPVVLGRHRVTPRNGAAPYTEIVGDDQYLRALFIWGYGPLVIEDIKIGETAISEFDDVDIETRYGYATDAVPSLYPQEVVQEEFQIKLEENVRNVRTTATDISEIILDFTWPNGLIYYTKRGKKLSRTTRFTVEARPTLVGNYSVLATFSIEEKTNDVIRRGLRYKVAKGQYDVRVTLKSEIYDGDDQVADTCYWTSMKGVRTNDRPLSFNKPLAYTAIRIKATSQLSGNIDTLNGICTLRGGKVYSGGVWQGNEPTRDPASLFRHVLQGPANARPVLDSQIDLVTLGQWSVYCKNEGFTFDMVRDERSSVYDALADIASAGRAAVVFKDGKWSVIWDEKALPIVQHFTPRNSWGFASERSYRDAPHAWRVRFINEAKGWLQDERIVYDDGYSAANATKFEGIEFPGVTKSENIWRHGRFHIAQLRLRPEAFTISVDWEHLICTRGDRVRVSHDVMLVGLAAGRVVSLAGNVVYLDEPVTMVSTLR